MQTTTTPCGLFQILCACWFILWLQLIHDLLARGTRHRAEHIGIWFKGFGVSHIGSVAQLLNHQLVAARILGKQFQHHAHQRVCGNV